MYNIYIRCIMNMYVYNVCMYIYIYVHIYICLYMPITCQLYIYIAKPSSEVEYYNYSGSCPQKDRSIRNNIYRY